MRRIARALFALAGLVYGAISFWWLIYSWVFVTLPLAERGTKEWEEDAMFIPFGAMGLVLWLALAGLLFVKLKKDKWNAGLFFGAAVLAGSVTLAAIYFL